MHNRKKPKKTGAPKLPTIPEHQRADSEEDVVITDENSAAEVAPEIDANYIQSHVKEYKQYSRYIKSRLPIALQTRVQNTAEINKLLGAKARVADHLAKIEKQAPDAKIATEIAELKKVPEKAVPDKSFCLSHERNIVTAPSEKELQEKVIEEAKTMLGTQGSILPGSEIVSGKTARLEATLKDPFISKDKKIFSAAVNLTIVGDQRLISVQRERGNAFVTEFYNLEQFTAPGIAAAFERFRKVNSPMFKWAAIVVEELRANSPYPDDDIEIRGKMPPKCVEAIVYYCDFKGYKCINSTTTKVEVTEKKRNAFRKKMREDHEAIVGVHDSLAYDEKAVDHLEKVTMGLKVS
jgi:hypothetical protein